MYLFELDNDTGLIKDDINNDGWKAIKAFKKLVDKEGLKALTMVALACDYLSPLAVYSDDERPYRAMEEIYDSRKKIDLEKPLFKDAMIKYRSLQKNNDLELDLINQKIEASLLERYTRAADDEDMDQSTIKKISDELYAHRERVTKFKNSFNKADVIKNHGVAQNGYVLSRIEQDIAYRRNSKFVKTDKQLENPNKLGLID